MVLYSESAREWNTIIRDHGEPDMAPVPRTSPYQQENQSPAPEEADHEKQPTFPGRLPPGARSVIPQRGIESGGGMTPSVPDGIGEGSKGAEFTTTLGNLLRGHKLAVENVGALRLRVAKEPEASGVEVECRRRANDGDRWWFVQDGIWMCEADSPVNAVVLVKAALGADADG